MLETGLMFGAVVIGVFIGDKLFGIGGGSSGSINWKRYWSGNSYENSRRSEETVGE